MPVIQVQSASWDRVYHLIVEEDFTVGDLIVLKTEVSSELARVISLEGEKDKVEEESVFLRRASNDDLEKIPDEKEKKKDLKYCYTAIKKLALPMKLVDIKYSLDDSRLTFAFTANGRVDFRDLVKELSSHFGRNIRLQQIGIRDESRLVGDTGRCGLGLCCKQHLSKFTSVTGEMAEVQQLGGRGSERLSGLCGRLMCCLAYEAEGYREKIGKMPELGTKVNVDGKRGTVVGHHILKESVDVKFPGENGDDSFVIEVDLNRNKKKDE